MVLRNYNDVARPDRGSLLPSARFRLLGLAGLSADIYICAQSLHTATGKGESPHGLATKGTHKSCQCAANHAKSLIRTHVLPGDDPAGAHTTM